MNNNAFDSKVDYYLSELSEQERGSLRKFTGGYYSYHTHGLRGGS